MRPLGVVVAKIFWNLSVPRSQGTRDSLQALLLERTDESLDVSIVRRSPHSAVAMHDTPVFNDLGEPLGELWSMV